MITIYISAFFLNERRYIIDTLFRDLLGLEVEIKEYSGDDYIIEVDSNRLIIKDCFFSAFDKKKDYLEIESIPKSILFAKNKFINEPDLPVIYGTDEIELVEDPNIVLNVGIDIFASSFFMLSRWEEYVIKERDEYGRFLHENSLAFKHNFLHRPVVNEYVEFLWNLLKGIGFSDERKLRNFQPYITHDIDYVNRWNSISDCLKTFAGDFLIRKSPKLFLRNCFTIIKVLLGYENDPYDTFEYLMNCSERMGCKSHFLFMGSTDKLYLSTDPNLKRAVELIKEKKHIIGLHPGLKTCNDSSIWQNEFEEIKSISGLEPKFCRQHYLSFEVPNTWQIMEDNNIEFDSSMSYPNIIGFRSGICQKYHVFNILTRKKLKIQEIPLSLMDVTLVKTGKEDVKLLKTRVDELVRIVRKYNGDFVLLWHNSNINYGYWNRFKSIFENILDLLK